MTVKKQVKQVESLLVGAVVVEAKRQFKRDCKAAGGTNADFVANEADFAFNGFASFD